MRLFAVAALLGLAGACSGAPRAGVPSGVSSGVPSGAAPTLSAAAREAALRMSPVPPPPPDPTNRWADDPEAAELGRLLFHAPELSKDGDLACATCHDPANAFVDGRRLASGVLPLERHTLSLWNVAHQRWFFWDGRADSLWAQALVPLEDPLEHAFTRTGVANAIYRTPRLRAPYEALFGPLPPLDDEARFPPAARPVPANDRAHRIAAEHAREAGDAHHEHAGGSGFYHPHQRAWDAMTEADRDAVTGLFVHVGKAIAAFERRFVSARAPFDVFVEGLREDDAAQLSALSPAAVRGFELFVGEAGCVRCHSGPLLTDFEFHDTGVPVVDGAPVDDPGRAGGVEALRASEFGVASRWSDDPDGPARVKVDYLPRAAHAHGAGEFKTPSLRNVARTPPYMHNGAFDTLEEVVDFYVTRESARPASGTTERILEPLDLSAQDRADLVAFLASLTDDSLELQSVDDPRR